MKIERDAIEAALKKHDGIIEKAAEELGASRRTLQNRMREYGMERGSFGEFLKAWMEERKDNGEAE
jgi:DNA-binding NtrC family response regulator